MISPAMTGHVDMEQVLWPSCPNITPDRVGHIPPMIFNLTINGSLQDLKKDTHPLDEHLGGDNVLICEGSPQDSVVYSHAVEVG